MSGLSSHLEKTLEDFRQQLAIKLAEAKKLLTVVNAIEENLGVPKTTASELTAAASPSNMVPPGESAPVIMGTSKSAVNGIHPDEYLGEPPVKAAKKFLRSMRRAVHIDDIADAVQRGGAVITGSKWKEDLNASLLRSTKDVVKVQDGIYGLTEFYTAEQLKALRDTRRQRPRNQGKRRKRGRPKKDINESEIKTASKKANPLISPVREQMQQKRRRRPREEQAQEPKEEKEGGAA